MYILELILDGFKSYATRTVISGFDRSFNAITGKNGSGKSNILDAILFVLSSSPGSLRAENLNALIYKSGQAGVTKASVTIVFDNTDPEQSPVGYEQFNQITVTRQLALGGRSKYIINGRQANLARVQNMFHSVGLNMQTPTFLVMQGMITKVLNAKPKQILKMIEETAGTSMFEAKKSAALDTISKKARKVDEIQKIIDEDISPTLEKLRKERKAYIQWSQNKTELERCERFVIAYEYSELVKSIATSEEKQAQMMAAAEELNSEATSAAEAVAEYDALIKELRSARQAEMEGEYKELEATVRELSKALVKASTDGDHKAEAVAEAKAALAKVQASIDEAKTAHAAKEEEAKNHAQAVEAAQAERDAAAAKVANLEAQLQGAGAALSGGSGDEGVGANSFTAQIGAAKAAAGKAASAIDQAKVKIDALQAQLAVKRPQLESSSAELANLHTQLEAGREAVEVAQAQLNALAFSEEEVSSAEATVNELEGELAPMRDALSILESKLARFSFEYADPERGFDRSKVKGLVGELISVNTPEAMTALEVTAGGKLFNVVVDTERTGSALLKKGKLRRRVTIIPLNKISGSSLSADVVSKAEALVGADNVTPALSLVGYDSEVDAAMKYVFGKSFVVSDMVAAKKVTFDKAIRTKSVTLEGDVFDPAGTLTGGSSRRASSSILAALAELSAARANVAAKENELAQAAADLAAARSRQAQAAALANAVALKEHELKLAKSAAAGSPQQQLFDDIAELEAQVAEAQGVITAAEATIAESEAKVASIEAAMAEFADNREAKLAAIEAEVKAAKKAAAKATKKFRAVSQAGEALQHEALELVNEAAELEAQIPTLESEIAAAEEAAAASAAALETAKAKYGDRKDELDEQTQRLAAADKKLASLTKARAKAATKSDKVQLAIRKAETGLKNFDKKAKELLATKSRMERKHEWLAAEAHLFGEPGSDFDFEAHNPRKLTKRVKALRSEQDVLNKSINKKVMNMFEQAEQEYQDLKRKKRIIENDKAKIEKVIAELDERKNEALHKTWVQVNADFGSIFSTFLPGTTAKLEPPEGKTVLDGLCVRVAFGTVWKESLSELSGGQRSLLALSLILAQMLFKPAPFMILDEVDAALDANHTAALGTVIAKHFSHREGSAHGGSQFILVSLRQGCHSNANVLFRTKFVDGVSAVTRTVRASNGSFATQLVGELDKAASSSSTSSRAKASAATTAVAVGGKRLRA
ncbi:condensin complex component subunit [Thecamonas trahens ATCC 50062]|uniref:Structural maintenance of chromosomes protein n=1 Tax=Thecamonas trahens ATCC 50062 TaxID=461836 RepID=A0A0L0DCE0_THETB|nr:condensin complex component subunit [Thecamonas trahens ATCC 50062]KNC50009.1 condensin complex component subunit [Thecamonas trahens ATCC 50062]|eukprot:XP_013757176.1 condensin complex component subunit [Thecamonas trahens ATCC 50062]